MDVLDLSQLVRSVSVTARQAGLVVPVIKTAPIEHRFIRWKDTGPVVVLPSLAGRDDTDVVRDVVDGFCAANPDLDVSAFLEAV